MRKSSRYHNYSVPRGLGRIVARLLLIPLLVIAHNASATQFEVSRLAAELNEVSAELANKLKYDRNYGSVRFSASRLSRAAADLVSAIRRNRSSSFLRSEFQDVARHYRELEEAFLRVNREHDRFVYSQVGLISNLFSGLNTEFYYTNYVEPAPQVFLYTPPVVTRHRLPPVYSGRSIDGVVPARERVIPERGRNNGVQVILPNRYSHRSSVVDRQLRQQFDRQALDSLGSRRQSGEANVGSRNSNGSSSIRYRFP